MPVRYTRALPDRHAHVGTALGTSVPPAGPGGTMPAISPSGESETALHQPHPVLPHPAPQPACCSRAALGAPQPSSCWQHPPPCCPLVGASTLIAWLACARPDSRAGGASAALAGSSSGSLMAPRGTSAAAPEYPGRLSDARQKQPGHPSCACRTRRRGRGPYRSPWPWELRRENRDMGGQFAPKRALRAPAALTHVAAGWGGKRALEQPASCAHGGKGRSARAGRADEL